MQSTSYLTTESPLHALCRHFNLHPTAPASPDAVGPTFNMQVYRDARMPTHVLAVTSTDHNPASPPLMLPIDATLFAQGFRFDLNLLPASPDALAPVPHTDTVGDSQVLVVTLPVFFITVPHVGSLPLLLLFGMKLETELNLLAWSLLPVNVVEEFPNAAAMSLILSRNRDDRFDRMFRHNQGIWKNHLAIGANDQRIVHALQTAWNVSAEARRIRIRAARQ
ncbi:hypothetical protein BYT27DRAFT_7253929 [Phlegmacium glaucopus]|nr:hypothetical protein BYT27DRAFT_7253929 [Phlegmacium glaucopus]